MAKRTSPDPNQMTFNFMFEEKVDVAAVGYYCDESGTLTRNPADQNRDATFEAASARGSRHRAESC